MEWTKISAFTFILFFIISCGRPKEDTTGLIAKVGEHKLTVEELQRNIKPGLPPADSLRAAKLFINDWLETEAATQMAERLLPNTAEIDRMVEDYRRQLLMWEYRRNMTLQQGRSTPSDQEIQTYYDTHKSTLKLQRPIVKGLYIKIPDDTKQLSQIHTLYRSSKIEDLDKLEKMLDNAVTYEYFRDTWVDWSSLESRIPAKEFDAAPDDFPATHDHLELKADGYVYLLQISDNKKVGETMPADYARAYIVEAIERENAVAYDKTLRRQLLDKAVREGTAQIYVDL